LYHCGILLAQFVQSMDLIKKIWHLSLASGSSKNFELALYLCFNFF